MNRVERMDRVDGEGDRVVRVVRLAGTLRKKGGTHTQTVRHIILLLH